MSALVLGLPVSSAKTFYDTQSAELNQMSADVVALDRLLAHYGSETKEAREELRVAVIRNLDRIWPQERTRTSEEPVSDKPGESLLDEIQALSPKDDKQRSLGAQALNLAVSIGRIRWLMYEQSNASFSRPLLVVLVFWLVGGFRRDFPDLGDVYAFHRTYPNLKRPSPLCSRTSRPIAQGTP